MSKGSRTHHPRPSLMTVQNVADDAQVSPKTVRRWIDSGDLAVIRLGRQIRVKDEDWLAFIRARRSS